MNYIKKSITKENNRNVAKSAGQKLILCYQRATINKLPSCRYVPSCSEYAYEAIETHGIMRGTWYSTKRLCRCHAWGGFGDDPVPETETQC